MCQTCIKTHSLTRAIREMKVAKIEGRKLQSFDDFINEMRGVWYYSLKAYRDIKNSLDSAEKGECKKAIEIARVILPST